MPYQEGLEIGGGLGVFYFKKVYFSSKCFMTSLYKMTFWGATKNWRVELLGRVLLFIHLFPKWGSKNCQILYRLKDSQLSDTLEQLFKHRLWTGYEPCNIRQGYLLFWVTFHISISCKRWEVSMSELIRSSKF